MKKRRLDYVTAKALFDYDPDRGHLFWRESRGRVRAGQRAGCKARFAGNSFWHVKVDGENFGLQQIAHLLMTGEWPTLPVDFRNGNGLDTRWSNLYLATHTQKQLRAGGQRGIRPRNGKWRARITVNYKDKFLGDFKTQRAAIMARRAAEDSLISRSS